jgi:molybdopterin/thiamine biosynthesis adenylyltransferase
MEWTSELQALASRNPYIDSLLKQGFDVGFINSYLVIFGVPALNASGDLAHLDLITPLDLREGWLIDQPSIHKMWFVGDPPFNLDGQRVSAGVGDELCKVSDAIISNKFLSSKPAGRDRYESIEEKITQYLDLVSSPAKHKFPAASPRKALREQMQQSISPLVFPDALSARDNVQELSHKLLGVTVAIVGCGGTGAYILDLIAKTHLAEIHLFDDDIAHVHTLFRLPGVFGEAALGVKKVDVLLGRYQEFHRGVKIHPERIDVQNVGQLSAFNFVFVAVDDGPSRQFICESCHQMGVAFVDVGMGLNKGKRGLYGFVRTAGGSDADFQRLSGTPYLPSDNAPDNEYRRQPQIAELNALNAAIAVIRFKQRFGFFDRLTDSAATVFDLAAVEIDQYG